MLKYQIKSVSPDGCFLFYTKKLPKVKDLLSIALKLDIDVELNVVECSQENQKEKVLQLINTKTYRKLGVI